MWLMSTSVLRVPRAMGKSPEVSKHHKGAEFLCVGIGVLRGHCMARSLCAA